VNSLKLFTRRTMNSYLVYEASPLRRGIKSRNPRIPRTSAVHLTPAFANVCAVLPTESHLVPSRRLN